ncbi:MAG TPA: SDR family oxidoreductase [Anaerolineae bacterium]|nr:SDR family oxidoreductase [Anaerolineae bacterium]HID83876.1 SDR family oxidoreductase [Anaerolineales bacterium]HIQ08929.1 SDR family oxidoreductase [Anaerolineaceae bacterium]
MRYVFLTGANRGLGLEFARQLLERGDWVFATCRHPERAEALRALQQRFPQRLHVAALDVSDEQAIARAATEVAAQTERLDVLINNAGVLYRDEHLGNLRQSQLMHAFAVNAVGPLLLTQALLPLLQKGQRPVVFNLSTQMGSLTRKTYGGYYSYSASKAALNMFGRALAADLRSDGVIVVLVHPGWVRTDMGGAQATLDPPTSVAGMLALLERLKPEDSGRFLTWEGKEHPW